MKGVIRRTRRTLAVVTLALAGCSGAMRAPTSTPEVIPLYFVADTNTSIMLNDLAANYQNQRPLAAVVNRAQIDISIQEYLANSLDTPTAARYAITTTVPTDERFWAAPLGYEGIAIITHPATPIQPLTASDMRQIFTGNATNWVQFNGFEQPITVVSHPPDTPIQNAFIRLVMGQREITLAARLALTPTDMVRIVQTTPGAIGVAPFSMSLNGVNVLPVAEFENAIPVTPSRETIANGIYPLQTPVLFIGTTPPRPGDGYYEFILWAQQGEGRTIVSRYYAPLPLSRQQPER